MSKKKTALPDLLPGMANRVETWPIGRLLPYGGNPWNHPEEQIDRLAASITRLGFNAPILVNGDTIVAGHARLTAAKRLGLTEVPVVPLEHLDEDTARAYRLADNRIGELAELDTDLLELELKGLEDVGLVEVAGWNLEELDDLGIQLGLYEPDDQAPSSSGADDFEEAAGPEVSLPGDLWILEGAGGAHRILCGDSTDPAAVARLMTEPATLVHADPPYGMGKEKDGVANDNLYAAKLDRFQMAWWSAIRPHIMDNASAYIWGNTEGLWRLWFAGGLAESEPMVIRNEVVWDKGGGGMGVGTASQRSYFPNERALFFMLGEQGFNNNSDNYWEGWEPLRGYLDKSREAFDWSMKDVAKITGVGMGTHWFTRSQWVFITEPHYLSLQAAARELTPKRNRGAKSKAFARDYAELRAEFEELRGTQDERRETFYGSRAWFDNTHDNMTDVWPFPRVQGEDRHGHATPKPVALVSRAIKSSAPLESVVLEPFLGSGSTLAAAELTRRRCFALELAPRFVDTSVLRWQKLTGRVATLDGDDRTFEEIAALRLASSLVED